MQKKKNKLQKDDGTISTEPKEILNMQSTFYSNLYICKSKKSKNQITRFLDKVNLPKVDTDIFTGYGNKITIEECYETLKTFKNKKSLGNDRLTIEFYQKCWPLFGTTVGNSFNYSYLQLKGRL